MDKSIYVKWNNHIQKTEKVLLLSKSYKLITSSTIIKFDRERKFKFYKGHYKKGKQETEIQNTKNYLD